MKKLGEIKISFWVVFFKLGAKLHVRSLKLNLYIIRRTCFFARTLAICRCIHRNCNFQNYNNGKTLASTLPRRYAGQY